MIGLRRFRPIIVVAASLLAVWYAVIAVRERSATPENSYGIPALMRQYKVPGVSVAVVKDFEVEWAGAWGVIDAVSGEPVTPKTMFQAASISRPVAAMASLKAIQGGKFGLDQDINTILESWQLPADGWMRSRPVTPRLLMSHTSGMGDGFGFPGYAPSTPLPSLLQILDGLPPSNVGPVRLGMPPASRAKYSGGAVEIEELALTEVFRKPFPEIMQKMVLEPLGMTNSTFEQPLPRDLEGQAAHAHDSKGQIGEFRWHVYPEHAAAGLWTTPTDLAKFIVEIQKSLRGESNKILSQAMTEEMVRPVAPSYYSVGFYLPPVDVNFPFFAHGGSNWGFRADICAHKTRGYGIIIMTNGTNGLSLIKEVEERIAQANGWELGCPIRVPARPQDLD